MIEILLIMIKILLFEYLEYSTNYTVKIDAVTITATIKSKKSYNNNSTINATNITIATMMNNNTNLENTLCFINRTTSSRAN